RVAGLFILRFPQIPRQREEARVCRTSSTCELYRDFEKCVSPARKAGRAFNSRQSSRGVPPLDQSSLYGGAAVRRGADRVRPRGEETSGITCPTPTSVEHADIQVKNYSINSRERYVCNSGFKRKAGTSSLTQCVFNETAKVAHWTTPNLKCIRDPSLSHQRPPSTAAPTGLTPEPESPTPSGKEPDLTSKSDTKVATRPTTGPGSRLPSTAPPVGTTGVVSKETTYVPAQTAAKAPEHTHPALQDTPGAYQHNPSVVTAAVSIPVAVVFAVCLVFLLVRCLMSRRAHQTPGVEMESMESVPMTTGADARGEDTETHLYGLGGSGDAEASSRGEGPALPQPERT
uniref:Interleukin-15 receptor subunit alpha n=1 Tax=Capra hircus TaxID=9925 RepID=A0A8C2PHD0_CAPHI